MEDMEAPAFLFFSEIEKRRNEKKKTSYHRRGRKNLLRSSREN